MSTKTNTHDMTEGHSLKILVAFTLPALAGNLLNQVYSITDSIIVGQYLGNRSLAAIGVCMPIVLLVASLIIGLNIGVGIIMSQDYGRKDIDHLRHSFANSIYVALVVATFVALVGVPLTVPILKAMGTPAGPLAEAAVYMKINFITTLFPLSYFLINNVFRAVGDSLSALYVLIVSVIINIGLDFLFVMGFHMGVGGSALATALSQAFSAIFAAALLYKKYPFLHLQKKDFAFDIPLIGSISKIAIPIALQNGFNNLGSIIVQSCINGFGESVMAAYTAASRIATLAILPAETVGNSLSFFSGQNFGAKKYSRIKQGVRASWIMNLFMSTVLGLFLVFAGKWIILMFIKEPTALIVNVAYQNLLITAVPSLLCGMMCIYQQVLRGFNKTNESVVGGFMQLGAKVGVALLGAKYFLNLNIVWFAWPISFIVGAIVPYFVYLNFIKKNKTDGVEIA